MNGNLVVSVNNGYEMQDYRRDQLKYYFVGVQLDGVNEDEDYMSTAIDFWADQSTQLFQI